MDTWVEVRGEVQGSYYWNERSALVCWELPEGAVCSPWVYVREAGQEPRYVARDPKPAARAGGRNSAAVASRGPNTLGWLGGRDPAAVSAACRWLGGMEAEGLQTSEPQPGGGTRAARTQSPLRVARWAKIGAKVERAPRTVAAASAQLQAVGTSGAAAPGRGGTWSERIQELAREEQTGLALVCVNWAWERRWPDERLEAFKPCKKMKDAVLRYVPGVVLVNDSIWVCQPLPPGDVLHDRREVEVAEARAVQIEAKPKEERQLLRHSFQAAGWERWAASYHRVHEALYRCTLRCLLTAAALVPAGRADAAASGSSPLAGTWTYSAPKGEPCDYDIVEEGSQLVFSETLRGAEVRGELRQAQDDWREASLPNGQVRLRWRGEGTIESQCRVSPDAEWSEATVARRSLRGVYAGYGPDPLLSAVSAMEEALQDPRLPPPPVPVPEPWARPSRSKAPGAASSPSERSPQAPATPFAPAEGLLEALMQSLAAARRALRRPAAEGDAPQSAADDGQKLRGELTGRFQTLVDGTCSLLDGESAVPLTETFWAVSKLLPHVWQYALALRDAPALGRLSHALQAAHRALFASRHAPQAGAAALPEPAGGLGMPLGLWEELVERSVRSAHLGEGLAEEALAKLPVHLAPPGAHYAAHFLQLLYHERLAELRESLAEAEEAALRAGADPAVFEGAWSQQPQHRPDLDLRPRPGLPRFPAWGYLRRGEVLSLMPWPPRRGLVVPVELLADFDASREREEGERPLLKLKLHTVVPPLAAGAEIFAAQDFAVAPLRCSKVPHQRQAEAVKAISRQCSGYHASIRGLILHSWVQRGPRPNGWSRRRVAAPAQPDDEAHCPRALAAEVPEDLEARAESRPRSASSTGGYHVPLTPDQERAMLCAELRRCTLVRGPPGTGKTHTACALIGRWVESVRRCRVLVVTQSNAAALNIHQRLEAFGLPSVRVGTHMKPEEILQQRFFLTLFEPWDMQPLREAVATGEVPPPTVIATLCQKAAKRSPVVVMTCISSGNAGLLGGCFFQRVLLDEAAQATEPTSLVPLLCGAAAFACIGDDRQLPATVSSRVARAGGLGESLFERLLRAGAVDAGGGFLQLEVQRRMHSSIADFPACLFYGGRISTGVPDAERPAVPGLRWPAGGACRVVFVDLAGRRGREESAGTSTCNRGEAELLVSTLMGFLKVPGARRVRAADVAIITGYSAQRDLIRREIRRATGRSHLAQPVRVDTVDGFQGMERDLVLVSTARSNAHGEVGFLRDPRRANVLLTRARRGLVIFGDARTLRSEEEVWGPWLRWVEARGGFVDAQGLERLQASCVVEA